MENNNSIYIDAVEGAFGSLELLVEPDSAGIRTRSLLLLSSEERPYGKAVINNHYAGNPQLMAISLCQAMEDDRRLRHVVLEALKMYDLHKK